MGIAGRSYLPKEKVEFQEKDATAIVQQFGLKLIPAIPGASGEQVLETIIGPSKERHWKLPSLAVV